jgi:hypothetical protein
MAHLNLPSDLLLTILGDHFILAQALQYQDERVFCRFDPSEVNLSKVT